MTVGAVLRPAMRFLFLVESAGVMFVVGLLLLAAHAVDRRAFYV